MAPRVAPPAAGNQKTLPRAARDYIWQLKTCMNVVAILKRRTNNDKYILCTLSKYEMTCLYPTKYTVYGALKQI